MRYQQIIRLLASPSLLCINLIWLIVLLIIGTVAQKYVGLYAAQQNYFASFMSFVGPIPLPGAKSVLLLISLGILAKLSQAHMWKWQKLGSNIIHGGIFILLAGSLFASKDEGALILTKALTNELDASAEVQVGVPDQQAASQPQLLVNHIENYYNAELTISEVNGSRGAWIFGQRHLKQASRRNDNIQPTRVDLMNGVRPQLAALPNLSEGLAQNLASNLYSESLSSSDGLPSYLSVDDWNDLGFAIQVTDFFDNIDLERLTSAPPNYDKYLGLARIYRLIEKRDELKSEDNLSGINFQLIDKNSGEILGYYAVFEDMPIVQKIRHDGKEYDVIIRPERQYLPFSLSLLDFKVSYYPASNVASGYESLVSLVSEDTNLVTDTERGTEANNADYQANYQQRVRISMNRPLRYKDWTIYQSSFIETPGQDQVQSIFVAVRNSARLLPYIAGLMIAAGLLLHLLIRGAMAVVAVKLSVPFLLLISIGLMPTSKLYADSVNAQNAQSNVEDVEMGMEIGANAQQRSQLNDPFEHFAILPVQHEGRIKPIDSFARIHLKLFAEKENLGDITASAWLGEMILSPEIAYQRNIFKVRNAEVREILQLEARDSNLFSFIEISQGLSNNQDLIRDLGTEDYNSLARFQQVLLDLAQKNLIYFDISRSLSLFAPIFALNNNDYAEAIGLEGSRAYNYMQVISLQSGLVDLIQELLEGENIQPSSELSASTNQLTDIQELLGFANLMDTITNDRNSQLLRVLPTSQDWLSPWQTIASGEGTPESAVLFRAWENLYLAYADYVDGSNGQLNQAEAWQASLASLIEQTMEQTDYSEAKLRLELFYNRANLFLWGLICFIVSLVLLSFRLVGNSPTAPQTSGRLLSSLNTYVFLLAAAGLVLQVAGIVIRIILLERPPVGNFYESLLFAGVTSVLGGLIVEYFRRDWIGIIAANFSGIILSMLGFYHLSQTLGSDDQLLIAVLNNNYWLSTHVTVIILGYAASIICAFLGHLALVKSLPIYAKMSANGKMSSYIIAGTNEKISSQNQGTGLTKSITFSAIVAIALMVMGTVLGGIWADQSWGRFWGWDPKENGALLIILWLAMLLHARMSVKISEQLFAASASMLSIAVALSWYGVNLLGVGLHSYGFIDFRTLAGLSAFIVFEIAFIATCLILARRKNISRQNEAISNSNHLSTS